MGYEWWTELVLLFNNINMRLPKWVVKWVKDNFDVDALELKCRQQEEKIRKLNKEIVCLKRDRLSEDERRWALNAYNIITWKNFSWELEFKEEYIEHLEFLEVLDEIANSDKTPF